MTRGGKRKGAGRKPLAPSKKRTVKKSYVLTPGQAELLAKAVRKLDISESQFVYRAIVEKIDRIK